MTIKKTMNYAVAIFAITIFIIATAPKLFAEYYSIYEGQTQEIKLKGLNQSVTITGLYKELIDLNTGEVLIHSPISDNSENPIYLNPNNQYRINTYFTASKEISKFSDIGSSLVVNAINSQNTLMPLGAYYSHNERINDILKLSIIESETGQEKYKYTHSYIIDSDVFKEIEKTTETYNEKPKNYTLTIGEWAKINSRNIQTKFYKVGDSFDVDGYTLTIKEIKENTTLPGLKHEVTISIIGNGLNAIETHDGGENIFENYLNARVKVNTVYSSKITIDTETHSETDNSDYVSFSNFADIAVKITTAQSPQNNSILSYKLDIPCAIDRTKIILPAELNPDYSGQYKTLCNSNAYFNSETGVYHLKKNEGYYIDLTILPTKTNKKINLEEIKSATLNFYNENNENACFTRILYKNSTEENSFNGKISYVNEIDSKEFARENMYGFVNACGINDPLKFDVTIESNTGEKISGINAGEIKYIVVDSDNSNIIAETARVANVPMTSAIAQRSIKTEATSATETTTRTVPTTSQKPVTSEKDFYMTTEKSVQKIIPVAQMLEENKIKAERIVGDINLETESEVPIYVFEVKEQKKLFGIIPIGEKIVEKRISATREIND
jgi:hypothetical protein